MGFLEKLLKTVVVVAVITFLPGLPPYGDFEVREVAPIRPLTGPLDPKDYALDKMKRIMNGRVLGPESTEASPTEPGVFYTALLDGDIVKISNNGTQLESLGVRLSKNCPLSTFDIYDPFRCGLPIGLRMRKDGRHLLVADSYLGIFEIDIETGKLENLVPPNEFVDGKNHRLYNSMAISHKTGKIYYTVSSTNYFFHEGAAELYGAPSGRVMVYDPTTKKSTVLGETFQYPKGIILSPDEDRLVVSECGPFKLIQYWLKGPKAGSWEVFADGFPGSPDNLNVSPKGTIVFPMVIVQMPNTFNPLGFLYQHPWFSKFVLRVAHLIKLPFDIAADTLNLSFAKYVSYELFGFNLPTPLFLPYSMAIEMDWNGKILRSWHARSIEAGKTFFSSANIIDGHLYMGSPYNEFIGQLKIE